MRWLRPRQTAPKNDPLPNLDATNEPFIEFVFIHCHDAPPHDECFPQPIAARWQPAQHGPFNFQRIAKQKAPGLKTRGFLD
jgi:hypothetical protein